MPVGRWACACRGPKAENKAMPDKTSARVCEGALRNREQREDIMRVSCRYYRSWGRKFKAEESSKGVVRDVPPRSFKWFLQVAGAVEPAHGLGFLKNFRLGNAPGAA